MPDRNFTYGSQILTRIFLVVFVVIGMSCVQNDRPINDSDLKALSLVDTSQPISAQIAWVAHKAVSIGLVEGVQYSIVEDGKILDTGAFGLADREAKSPMTVDTPINVASISKSVSAWGVLALTRREGIDLNSSVAQLLGDRSLAEDLFGDSDVSLRMLLSHTSGLSGPSVPVTPITERIPEITDVLLGNSTVPSAVMKHTPGDRYTYSGAGFLVLQKVIEEQTQQRFSDYMARTVFVPAGMANSSFQISKDIQTSIAVYYR